MIASFCYNLKEYPYVPHPCRYILGFSDIRSAFLIKHLLTSRRLFLLRKMHEIHSVKFKPCNSFHIHGKSKKTVFGVDINPMHSHKALQTGCKPTYLVTELTRINRRLQWKNQVKSDCNFFFLSLDAIWLSSPTLNSSKHDQAEKCPRSASIPVSELRFLRWRVWLSVLQILYWRSKDEVISDVLLLTLLPAHIYVGRLGIHQLHVDIRCPPQNLAGVMDDRDGWREIKGNPCYHHDFMTCIYIYIYTPRSAEITLNCVTCL